jgi:Tfp pilus assembly protein PilF
MIKVDDNQRNALVFLGLISIFFLCVIIYSNTFNAPFVFDDNSSIVYNSTIKSLKNALVAISDNRYLGYLSFSVNYAVAGLNPFGYHVTNVLIHAANALLVYYLITLTFMTPALAGTRLSPGFIAIATAFIFLAHPIQTQAVTYIAQRFASMATFFYLLSIISYVKARLNFIETKNFSSKRHLGYYLMSIVFACFAMKTKEIAFTLPFALGLYEIYFFDKGKSFKKRFLYLIPIFLTLLVIPLTMLELKTSNTINEVADNFDNITKDTWVTHTRSEYLYTQFRVIVTYLRLLILPVNQNLDYDLHVSRTFFSGDVIASFLFLSMIFALGILAFKKYRLVSFGVVWFFLTLSVESSIIPIRDVIVEHRVYLPSVGFFMAAVALMDQLIPKQKVKIVIVVALISVLAISTYLRNNIWREEEYIWKDAIARAPNNARAYGSLGIVYKKRGEHDKAIELFEKSMSLGKAYPEVFLHLGDIYFDRKDYNKAVMYLEAALKIDFSKKVRLGILNKLGRTYGKLGENEKAVEAFEEAIRLYPDATVPYNNLGVLYARTGQIDKAIDIFEQALKTVESKDIYYNLAVLYTEKGNKTKAIDAYKKSKDMTNE